MKKKIENFTQVYTLDGEGIESFSKTLGEKLTQIGLEKENRIRIRFSLEECLLRMRDHIGDNARVVFSIMVNRFGRPILQITQEGERYNPLSKTEVELEDWSGSLLTAVGLYTQYSYNKGKNILRINLPSHRMNPALKLLIAVAIGLALGFLFLSILSDPQQDALVADVLQPFYELWIRILSVFSGPVVFLMVITTFLNTGAIEEQGGNSRRVALRYFGFSLAAAVMAGLTACAVSGNLRAAATAQDVDTAGFLSRLFSIVPDNAISPLIQANTPQILLIAFILGNGLVVLGSRAEGLISIIRQMNAVGLLMADWVSRCVPFFALALICYEVLRRQGDIFIWLWLVLLLSLILALLYIAVVTYSVSRKENVSFRTLLKKLRPSFAKAVRTGRLDEGFGDMQVSCVKDLGIERNYVEISLPMGMTLYMPVNVIGTLIFTIFAAAQQNVAISAPWLITALVLAVVMFAATPPVPGANLLTYIMLFRQLGVPSVMLVAAMVFDILFGIFAGAGNQMLLQLDLILQADQIGLLDKKRLRR